MYIYFFFLYSINCFSENNEGFVVDHFKTTDRMSTFTFGFVSSELSEVVYPTAAGSDPDLPTIRVWARPEFHGELQSLRSKLITVLKSVSKYWAVKYPLGKLDVVALPGFSALKPIDNWGLLVFKLVVFKHIYEKLCGINILLIFCA